MVLVGRWVWLLFSSENLAMSSTWRLLYESSIIETYVLWVVSLPAHQPQEATWDKMLYLSGIWFLVLSSAAQIMLPGFPIVSLLEHWFCRLERHSEFPLERRLDPDFRKLPWQQCGERTATELPKAISITKWGSHRPCQLVISHAPALLKMNDSPGFAQFCNWGSWVSERLNNLPNVKKCVNGKTWTCICLTPPAEVPSSAHSSALSLECFSIVTVWMGLSGDSLPLSTFPDTYLPFNGYLLIKYCKTLSDGFT